MVTQLSARVQRVRAPNPSPMTLEGTNSYVIDVGEGDAVVIDPGPPIEAHVDALLDAVRAGGMRRVAAILVTHGHPDHAPGAASLAARSGAPVWAHPAARFPHDRALADGEPLRFATATFDTVDAPGHTFDHLVFRLHDEAALFTGDVVIGRGTVVIAPPGGAMRPYQATLRRLLREHGDARRIYGGHGAEVDDPASVLRMYISHREEREAAILAALREIRSERDRSGATLPQIVGRVYVDVDRTLWPAAGRQVLAYLLALDREGTIVAEPAGRPATPEEALILHPDLSRLADPVSAELAAAELGVDESAEPLLLYRLRGAP